MRFPGLFAGFLTLTGCATASITLAPNLGVAPADVTKYSGNTFKCFDGSGAQLSASAVNDFYCDCADGSDEPGTGACAGQEKTLFFCPNKGSTARSLYASRVGDGICDCCDGSDEAALASRRPALACKDVCAEQGAKEKEEMKRRIDSLTRGVAKREEIAAQALKDRAEWHKEVERLKAELPALEKAHEEAKEAADAAKKLEEEANKDCPESCMWRQTGGCVPTGEREEANDKKCTATIPKGSSGFCDCDGDGVKGEAEPGFDCTGGERKCCAQCKKLQEEPQAPKAGEENADGAKEEKVVSEYTKWMDGAQKAMESKDEKEDKVVSEYTKWMDGAEKAIGDKDGDVSCKFTPEKTGWFAGTLLEEKTQSSVVACKEACCKNSKCRIFVFRDRDSMCLLKDNSGPAFTEEAGHTSAVKIPDSIGTESGKLDSSASDVESVRRAALKELNNNKDETKKIQQKIDALSDDHLGYASLAGKTLSKHIGEFDYKVTFFTDAKQGHTSLGKWDKWTGKNTGLFSGGATCWSGPARQLDVKFQCGIEEALEDVSEPSRCVYEAVLTHPGACDPEELKSLGSSDRVVGPRDEL